MITVFIVDDHPLVRKGLADAIDTQPDMTAIGQADSPNTALREIGHLQPDVALLDISLGDTASNGIDLCRDIHQKSPPHRLRNADIGDQ